MPHPHQHHGAEKVVTGARLQTSCDMNVTPLIDVLLVLLVIFMAALPLAQKGMDVNLPSATGERTDPGIGGTPIVLEFTADRKLSVNHQDVPVLELGARLRAIFERRTDKTMFIIGAGTLRYGSIIDVIDAARGAGVERVGIVTEGMRQSAGIGQL